MSFGPCAEHNPAPPYNRDPRPKGQPCAICKRIGIEGRVFKRVVRDALKAGFEISLFDCEEMTVTRSRNAAELEEAAFTTDDDRLYISRPGQTGHFGWVWFVYGNDAGWDVICDYTTNLEEPFMRSVVKWCIEQET